MAPAPYSVELDADTARKFAETGATLLLLGVLEHTVVGIDQQARCMQHRKSARTGRAGVCKNTYV